MTAFGREYVFVATESCLRPRLAMAGDESTPAVYVAQSLRRQWPTSRSPRPTGERRLDFGKLPLMTPNVGRLFWADSANSPPPNSCPGTDLRGRRPNARSDAPSLAWYNRDDRCDRSVAVSSGLSEGLMYQHRGLVAQHGFRGRGATRTPAAAAQEDDGRRVAY